MTRLREWLIAGATLAYGRRRRRRERELARRAAAEDQDRDASARIVPAGAPDRRAEYLVTALLALAALFAAGFVVVYAVYSPPQVPNQLLGVCIGGALACVALALAVFAQRLIVTEELEDDYPQESPEQQREIAQLVHESGSRLTRRQLLVGAASAAGGALGLAGLTPVLSLGPLWDTAPLDESPWHRGRRLVDPQGHPMRAAEVEEETFYTAFAEGANPEDIATILVVLRLRPSELRLPAGRGSWAPGGILAYSKICTHAGCAVALYRKPRFPVVEPKPALVCPCHYSTFNPATGASVIFGPAGRPLPQLPLMVDTDGYLAAAGDFSGRVGPAWWGVRERPS
jgi:quinol---cytochrome c reductase iron-sulfur subunit